jgi:hypothetical protein
VNPLSLSSLRCPPHHFVLIRGMIARAPEHNERRGRKGSTRCQMQAGGCVHKYHDHGIAERVLPRQSSSSIQHPDISYRLKFPGLFATFNDLHLLLLRPTANSYHHSTSLYLTYPLTRLPTTDSRHTSTPKHGHDTTKETFGFLHPPLLAFPERSYLLGALSNPETHISVFKEVSYEFFSPVVERISNSFSNPINRNAERSLIKDNKRRGKKVYFPNNPTNPPLLHSR